MTQVKKQRPRRIHHSSRAWPAPTVLFLEIKRNGDQKQWWIRNDDLPVTPAPHCQNRLRQAVLSVMILKRRKKY